jgi:hypothetical protein
MEKIELRCLKQGGKLRVRIVTPGYYTDANCQFPRELRAENTRYRVSPLDITLITSRGKYYYSIRNRDRIEVLAPAASGAPMPVRVELAKLYEDMETPDCAICFDAPKQSVLYPCGHFYTCTGCSRALQKCPICRADILRVIDKSEMD